MSKLDILNFKIKRDVLNYGNQGIATPLLFTIAEGQGDINLAWDGWHDSYEIWVSTDGGLTYSLEGVTNSQAYTVTTTNGIEYYFQVRGFEANEFSDYTDGLQGVSGSFPLYLDGEILYLDGSPLYLVGVA